MQLTTDGINPVGRILDASGAGCDVRRRLGVGGLGFEFCYWKSIAIEGRAKVCGIANSAVDRKVVEVVTFVSGASLPILRS